MRSFLTVLGIVIGVAAVIAMVTIGIGHDGAGRAPTSPSSAATCSCVRAARPVGSGASTLRRKRFNARDVQAIADQV